MQLVTTVWFHTCTYMWLQLQTPGFVVTVDYIHVFTSGPCPFILPTPWFWVSIRR